MKDVNLQETAVSSEADNQEQQATLTQRLLMLVVAAIVIAIDHLTKLLVEATLPLYHSWAPFPALALFFRITHVTNTGAAFGLFSGNSLIFAGVAVLVTLVILYYNYTLPYGQGWLRVALGLQLGGALGNLIDRIRLGHVTDFFDFGFWPVFNVADTAIVAGAILLAWLMWQESRQETVDLPEEKAVETGVETAETETQDGWSAY
ncbi:MAG: signal peptidase II [Chloroflexi bacterium]|nr:MAG: signal peptidase II [Chloroflexota bacterium]